ncbi:hypothetical protein CONPUDRAFT_145278 [Coniophora puteana RWD-64-598 SS2]|uniref:ZZ-type domain-containing protein n=1 Tax=Coniophora puteana (strain RWD-64-598) TaxID=741705 RepID=A0A5M3MKG9_CONPW|nr:uncharacterized protein CONPUDRAFT_145278 [Coniophora puteana RWD-64-598 SS2]EIW79145.1 hypothetical protein CONPUDRAFT_145278 [Coniophora puteana RWD-64-598 SS2]
MQNRPDRPLVVKCSFDRRSKRISFQSARHCSYEVLRRKVELCFSFHAMSFMITYKDDDGEVTDIASDTDLTEAILYFQAGTDDPPLSSAASILSGRSFRGRDIILRVQVTVDYDGPSLSDTSSLASIEEYRAKNTGSEASFSFGAPTEADLDDDAVTVSSKDTGGRRAQRNGHVNHLPRHIEDENWDDESMGDSLSLTPNHNLEMSDTPPITTNGNHDEGPFSDRYQYSEADDYNEDRNGVFKRLKLEEQVDNSHPPNDRGVAWLRDQNARAIKYKLGASPEPSESDGLSLSNGQDGMSGDLALERDTRGKYYYTYTSSGGSQIQEAGNDDGLQELGNDDALSMHMQAEEPAMDPTPRPNSMQLTWLASQQKVAGASSAPAQSSSHAEQSRPPVRTSISEPIPEIDYSQVSPDIPPEVLQFLPVEPPSSDLITDCSECGVLLDAIRYVCSTCGEKRPAIEARLAARTNSIKGKARELSEFNFYVNGNSTYPPSSHRTPASSSPTLPGPGSTGSSAYHRYGQRHPKPLPSLPPTASATSLTLRNDGPHLSVESGYELCSGCLEAAGVIHGLQMSQAQNGDILNGSPTSPQDLSQWRRTAPRQKGQFRHAYIEMVWGHMGWDDVEQTDTQSSKCSTCNSALVNKHYKCASCQKFNLCLACYSQVHDIHPSHAFLVVQDRPSRSRSEPDFSQSAAAREGVDEPSLKHPGVKCAHCLQDIVGARFHCAICDSVDICANCESAGLPGNLDSSDGGHTTSHIMIKIPYPLETDEVQIASRRAFHLWTGRDAAHVMSSSLRSKPSSIYSSYAQTVIGPRSSKSEEPVLDHHTSCNGCHKNIVGDRYQCATCSSSPTAYNLCAGCEKRSYALHDPMHAFFKLPRPVARALQSATGFLPKLYKTPAGPPQGASDIGDPEDYLNFLIHSTAWCDRCMEPIHGAWYRCAYCAKDLCGDCQALDTHDTSHVFVVFKAPVDIAPFRQIANLENPNESPPIIPYAVYG